MSSPDKSPVRSSSSHSSFGSPVNRRDFMRLSAMAAALAGSGAAPFSILRAQDVSPNSKPNIAMIGMGSRGYLNLKDTVNRANIVAICDVNTSTQRTRNEHAPEAKFYQDYRKMFDEMGKQIDGVQIATPDHNHFVIAMRALKERKHLFIEKPLAHKVAEARKLRLEAAKAGVVTQMGNQGHAGEGIRLIQEWFEAGILGKVERVVYIKKQPAFLYPSFVTPPPVKTPPPTLDWNLWVAGRRDLGYREAELYKRTWRAWWEYGSGALGDFGCHFMDAAVHALNLGAPISIDASTNNPTDFTVGTGQKITYRFPARGEHPPVELVWMDGDMADWTGMPEVGQSGDPKQPGGKLEEAGFIIGDKLTVFQNMYGTSVRLVPDDKFREVRGSLPPKRIPRIKGSIISDWLDGIVNGTKPCSNFEVSAPLAETVQLGNVAARLRRKINWDAAAMTTGDKEADALLHPPAPREGWEDCAV